MSEIIAWILVILFGAASMVMLVTILDQAQEIDRLRDNLHGWMRAKSRTTIQPHEINDVTMLDAIERAQNVDHSGSFRGF